MKLKPVRLLHLLLLAALSACGGGESGDTPAPPSGTVNYAAPSREDDLTIQLAVDDSHPLMLPARSAVMEVDLFDTDRSVFEQLHAQGAKVLCYFSAGSWEAWRDDADDYPTDIIGNDYAGWPGEKWVDIRDARLKPILQARLDLARDKGCDGVDPDNVNGYENDTGFTLSAADQLAFNRWLAREAHARGLFIALKNDGNQAAELVDEFDAVVSEQCYAYGECGLFDPFLAAGKPVWDIEYTNTERDYRDGDIWNQFCRDSNDAGRHGYWLPDNLDGSFRHSCQARDNLWNDLSIGFGDGASFAFQAADGGALWLSAATLMLDEDLAANATVLAIKNSDAQVFARLHRAVSQGDFLSLWVTPGWETAWFDSDTLQQLVRHGRFLVFNYWYFGDTLANGLPDAQARSDYLDDAARLGRLIATLPGPVVVNFEPEFNKPAIMADEQNRQAFIDLMAQAIDRLKAEAPQALISLTMMDTGRRDEDDTSPACGYDTCALGDRAAWEEVRPVFDALADRLDVLSFQQMVGQFSRNPAQDSQPVAYTDRQIGIVRLPERIANLAGWLHDNWHKPVMIPYMAVATATWSDDDGDGAIDAAEINSQGWEAQAQSVMAGLKAADMQTRLRQRGVIALAAMSLFDDPQHDAGGYRFFLDNEYHLGLIATGAQAGVNPAADGALRFKGSGGNTLVETLFDRSAAP